MKRVIGPLIVLGLLTMTLAACGASDVTVPGDDAATTDGQDATSLPPETSTTRLDVELIPATTKAVPTTQPPAGEGDAPVYETGDDPVAFAISDLAHRLGIDEDEVVFVEQVEVVWRDGSIGCPQPGMSYTQALVDGSRIVLEVDGDEYFYHQAASRAPFWCENPAE